jgi:hypothetical protein
MPSTWDAGDEDGHGRRREEVLVDAVAREHLAECVDLQLPVAGGVGRGFGADGASVVAERDELGGERGVGRVVAELPDRPQRLR